MFSTQLLAQKYAAVGEVHRLQIVRLLSTTDELCVSDIAVAVELSVACASHHLQLLKEHGICLTRRDGNTIYYQLNNDQFVTMLRQQLTTN